MSLTAVVLAQRLERIEDRPIGVGDGRLLLCLAPSCDRAIRAMARIISATITQVKIACSAVLSTLRTKLKARKPAIGTRASSTTLGLYGGRAGTSRGCFTVSTLH